MEKDYSACGRRLIVRGDPTPGTYSVAIYCDRPYAHVGNHHADIEWDSSTPGYIAQGG